MKITIPYGLKTHHRKFRNSNVHQSWKQIFIDEDDDKAVRDRLIAITKYKGKKLPSVILHFCSDSVQYHMDYLAKSAYIIPVHSQKGWKFVVDDYAKYREVDMKPGTMIKFNDHHRHGLFRNDAKGYCIFYTVSFDKDPR